MRTIKKAEDRKNEILDAVEILFAERGAENTSTSDILSKVGIARGTLYHHFKSKEEIIDGWIERITSRALQKAENIASDPSLSVYERFLGSIAALQLEEAGNAILEYLHKPQNAWIHQKAQKKLLLSVPPILVPIIHDGITQGLFTTTYPYEAVEMILLYASTIFDDDLFPLSPQQKTQKGQAFLTLAECLLGATHGSFACFADLIGNSKVH